MEETDDMSVLRNTNALRIPTNLTMASYHNESIGARSDEAEASRRAVNWSLSPLAGRGRGEETKNARAVERPPHPPPPFPPRKRGEIGRISEPRSCAVPSDRCP